MRALARRRRPRAASARRRSTKRRRSTRTSARGTPRVSPPCSRYALLPARRRALRRTRSAGVSMRRGRLCAAAPPMRARVRTRAGTRLCGAMGVVTAARRGGSVHVSIHICVYMCVCLLHAYTYIIHLSVCVRIGRGYACVHQCAMVMDRLCAHGLAGSCCGLGLKPETLNRASPCPSAWTACGFGAQAFQSATAFNANIGAWNTASVTTLASVCAFSARRRALWRTRSAGLLCGAACCARRHRRCARACAHVQAVACAGPWV